MSCKCYDEVMKAFELKNGVRTNTHDIEWENIGFTMSGNPEGFFHVRYREKNKKGAWKKMNMFFNNCPFCGKEIKR